MKKAVFQATSPQQGVWADPHCARSRPYQTHPTYPTPQGGARSARALAAPRSTSCTLLVDVEAAGP
eukprot:6240322-Prymnesium_polylepis.1